MVRVSSQAYSNAPGGPDDENDAPLDPAVERIRQRLKRLILVSSATLLIGLVAVLAAVIYRVGHGGDKPALQPMAAEMVIPGAIPAGARVISSALDGTLLAVTVDMGGSTRILVVDLTSGKIVRRIALGQQ
ncbi:DUF6476 family protein [Kaistia dalseonensis]|uniref:Fimbrial protein n=1 Tax=Kaistia dalseonensis TaxID=410840 RepID=A0ABU0HA02_9HYPH|nr:DUF6476 family protein [Kaistia dalseonensis]MCX5496522.1 DUF6476 family protein [Kaistia dalseonensis]MDQ0439144.1 hypothetical protein [Kaistia dalseonensis]